MSGAFKVRFPEKYGFRERLKAIKLEKEKLKKAKKGNQQEKLQINSTNEIKEKVVPETADQYDQILTLDVNFPPKIPQFHTLFNKIFYTIEHMLFVHICQY